MTSWQSLLNQLENSIGTTAQQIPGSRLLLWLVMKRLGITEPVMPALQGHVTQLDEETREAHALLASLSDVDLFQTEMLDELFQQQMNPHSRENSGSYYTETSLAGFMVKESLRTHYHQWMKHHEADGWFPLEQMESTPVTHGIPPAVLDAQAAWLDSLTLLDLSCGSGVFLRQGLVHLIKTAQWIEVQRGGDAALDQLVMKTATRQLTGVDMNPEAVMMADMMLRIEMLRLMGKEAMTPELQCLRLKVACADALTWEPDDNQRYQLILGNPPYLGEKGHRPLFDQARSTRVGALYYEKNMDFSYYFIHRGLELLETQGCLCYITTSYFTTADGARRLRQRLYEEAVFHWLINPEKTMIFPHAKGQHNLIYCLGAAGDNSMVQPMLLHLTQSVERSVLFERLYQQGIKGFSPVVFDNPLTLFDQRGQLMVRSPGMKQHLLKQLEHKTVYQLQDLCFVNQGLVSGADRLTSRHQPLVPHEAAGKGIFVLDEGEKDELLLKAPEAASFLKPFFKNSHIWPYEAAGDSSQWLLYLTDKNMPDITRVKSLEQHLAPYRPILEKRREVKMGLRKWHSLHWPRDPEIFEGDKIVAPQRSMLNVFARVSIPWYASADVYYLSRRETCFHSLDYLTAWLNSALCYAWLNQHGKMKGSDLELYASPLKAIPVPLLPGGEAEEWVLKKLENRFEASLEGNTAFLGEMDHFFLELMEISVTEAGPLLEQVHSLRSRFRRRGIL